MTELLSPAEVIGRVSQVLSELPACIAGSSVAAETYGMPLSDSSDVDVFAYSEPALMAGTQKLLDAGFNLHPRFERVWERWLQFGCRTWHTNSIKFLDPDGLEVNIVHKLTGGHPANSLAAVLESFDFGLLGVGYDLQLGQRMDLRSFLFPSHDLDGPLPLMPNKRASWRRGLISQYNGIREVGRYAKYVTYGHDLSLVKDDLVEGYLAAALYMGQRDQPEKQQLGKIYEAIAYKLEWGDIDDILKAGQQIQYLDALDEIMDALE